MPRLVPNCLRVYLSHPTSLVYLTPEDHAIRNTTQGSTLAFRTGAQSITRPKVVTKGTMDGVHVQVRSHSAHFRIFLTVRKL